MAPLLLFIGLLALSSACAARAPVAPPRDVLAESAGLLRAGCYRCFQEGLALVEGRTGLAARQRAFELIALLAARAKELGLPFQPWRDRAAALAATLPPESASSSLLSLLDALRSDPAGLDRDQDFAQRRWGAADHVRGWVASIASSSASAETKAYFSLAAACAFLRDDREAEMTRVSAIASGVPLLAYALGSCGASERLWLQRALVDEPRLDDAAYVLGRYLSGPLPVAKGEPDPGDLLARARGAFPESSAIVYSEAALYRERRNWGRALEGFDATLTLVPKHHDARLGRVIALSNLVRHDEAIAGATSLIEEGTWLVGDAYYWRAWNAFTLGRLDDSERDVEQAKQRMRWSAALVLSGLVQWRKGRQAAAEGELAAALAMAADDCDAAGYLGGVRADMRKWVQAADAFRGAAECRDRETAGLRATVKELVARGAPAAAIDAQQKSIEASERTSAEMRRNRETVLDNGWAAYRMGPPAYCALN